MGNTWEEEALAYNDKPEKHGRHGTNTTLGLACNKPRRRQGATLSFSASAISVKSPPH